MFVNMTQEFFLKIIQLFRDNLDKAELFKVDEDTGIKTLSLVMFRPFVDKLVSESILRLKIIK